MSHGVRGGAAVRPNRGPHSHLHATDPVDTPPILRGRRSASAYPKAGAPARQPIKVPHLSASGQVAGVVDAAGGHGASRVDADDSSHARLDQDLFAKDLFAKETINVARSESGSLLADAMGASASASHGASAPSHLDSGMGWSQRPFVIVTNPVPHPKNTDGASTAVAGESKDGPGMAKAVHPQNMLLEPVSPSIQNQVNVGYFETGDDFLDACRELLANHHEGVLFWIDVDLSVMTTSQQLLFFQLFRFNQITRNDCVSEDRYVSDTRVARYLRYLFCIVDTVDDISAVTPMDEIQEDIAGAWITKNLNIVLFEFGVVSVHLRGVDVTDDVVGRINTGRGVIPSCGWILWCLLDVMTDQMSPFLDASVAAADAIDSESVKLSAPESLPKLLAAGPAPGNRCQRYSTTCCCRRRSTGEGESSDDSVAAPASSGDFLLKMGRARRDLERLKSSYMSKLELVEKLQSDAVGHVGHDIQFHLSSLLSQIKWKMQRTAMAQLNLKSAYQNYVTCVSLASAATAGRANETTKSLTLLLAITTPLNLVASIMGMNVYPLNTVFVGDDVAGETPWVFVAVLLSFVLITVVLFVVAKMACGLRLC